MRAGLLKHRITLREPVLGVHPKGAAQTFNDTAGILADVRPQLASEQTLAGIGGDNIAAQYDLRIIIRYRPLVDTGWHVVWRANEYRIEAVADEGADRRWLTLGCKRLV